jgi:hypothetical protein
LKIKYVRVSWVSKNLKSIFKPVIKKIGPRFANPKDGFEKYNIHVLKKKITALSVFQKLADSSFTLCAVKIFGYSKEAIIMIESPCSLMIIILL